MIRAQDAGWTPGAQKHTSRGNVICPPLPLGASTGRQKSGRLDSQLRVPLHASQNKLPALEPSETHI